MVPLRCEVIWVDSARIGDSAWTAREDFEPVSETLCTSLGWQIGEDDNNIYIAGHISEEEYGGIWQIPRSAIKKLRYF